MKDNVKLFVFVMVLLVLTFAYFIVRFLKEEKRQEAIVTVRNRIEGQKVIGKSQNFRETEQLNMPEESFLQGNEGDGPRDENFPVIKMQSYGEKSKYLVKRDKYLLGVKLFYWMLLFLILNRVSIRSWQILRLGL